MANTVLVTGGAGYIGSHVVRQLGERGDSVVVLDNLDKGFREAVLYGDLIEGDVGDQELVSDLLREYKVDAVMHFAAHTVVPESVANPMKYYTNNTRSSLNLLQCCQQAGVDNFVFSSTCAVYGILESGFASELTPTCPINAYGSSKLATEWLIRDLCAVGQLSSVCLRYFNVAGCDPGGRIGQSTPEATLLTKVACEAAVGKREAVVIYGTDYNTPDGTGVRDYVHVEDLANAHLLALDYLEDKGQSTTLNCGYGHGYSVREVLRAVERANGEALNIVERERRLGDPPKLIAECKKIKDVLGWIPKYDDLDAIVTSALAWEKAPVFATSTAKYQ